MLAVTAAQMRAADAAAVARGGDVVLMRAAGEALADGIALLAAAPRKLVAFAGPGNNGGDAYAAFAAFAGRGAECEYAVYAAPRQDPSEGRRDAERRARAAGVATHPLPTNAADALAALTGADVALDALLGTGARPQIPVEFVPLVDALAASDARVLAVDVPTGIDATTGAAGDRAVRADATVSLGAVKLGLLLEPARSYAGVVYEGDIGLGDDLRAHANDAVDVLDDDAFLRVLPRRHEESDKRISGAPLVIAGSEQFPGAGILCARGAARAGAGYVTVAAPAGAAGVLRGALVEQVVVTYDESDPERAVEQLLSLTQRSNAVAIGPGLGLSENTGRIVVGFLERLERPFVADASALFHLSKNLERIRGKACLLTPHAGEFARLSGAGTIAPGERASRLRAFVARTGITTLLKGNATLIDDGTTLALNVTGTSALATAGTGDVLTGIVATLLAQGLAPFDAARTGAYWHGLAGRYAAKHRRVGVVAGDVYEALGFAVPEPLVRRGRLRRLTPS